MKYLQEIKYFEARPGSTIEEAADEALKIAVSEDCIVKLIFNDIPIQIRKYDDCSSIVEYYNKQQIFKRITRQTMKEVK